METDVGMKYAGRDRTFIFDYERIMKYSIRVIKRNPLLLDCNLWYPPGVHFGIRVLCAGSRSAAFRSGTEERRGHRRCSRND